jgi:hypothetical protein
MTLRVPRTADQVADGLKLAGFRLCYAIDGQFGGRTEYRSLADPRVSVLIVSPKVGRPTKEWHFADPDVEIEGDQGGAVVTDEGRRFAVFADLCGAIARHEAALHREREWFAADPAGGRGV